jgi:hypothetical protein
MKKSQQIIRIKSVINKHINSTKTELKIKKQIIIVTSMIIIRQSIKVSKEHNTITQIKKIVQIHRATKHISVVKHNSTSSKQKVLVAQLKIHTVSDETDKLHPKIIQ